MDKVFLYLYPIKEFASSEAKALLDDNFCNECNIKRPFLVLNEAIEKRYREKGYQVVYALYPGREIYGIVPQLGDKVIFTDVSFEQAINTKGEKDFVPKYPNEELLLEQLGDIEELVVGGYHYSDCVRRVAEKALQHGISTLVDLDMTDLFFNLYKQEDYFCIEEYDPMRYKEYFLNKASKYGEEFAKKRFASMYASEVYGFNTNEPKFRK